MRNITYIHLAILDKYQACCALLISLEETEYCREHRHAIFDCWPPDKFLKISERIYLSRIKMRSVFQHENSWVRTNYAGVTDSCNTA